MVVKVTFFPAFYYLPCLQPKHNTAMAEWHLQCEKQLIKTKTKQKQFVDMHNKYRSEVAKGMATIKGRKKAPHASNMNKLVNFCHLNSRFSWEEKKLSTFLPLKSVKDHLIHLADLDVTTIQT